MATIEGTMKGIPDVKRFYMPGVKIVVDCQCGRRVERDLSDHYLSYPVVGEAFDEIVYCHDCDSETKVRARLDVALVLADAPAPSPLTVEELARALDDAFEADDWGDIDPYLFKEVINPSCDDAETLRDANGLRAVLLRVVDKLNGGAP